MSTKKSESDKEFYNNFQYFKKLQEFIFNDLEKSCVFAQTNFLTAMGIFNYIEILGGFYQPNEKPGLRFEKVMTELFPSEYKIFLNKLTTLIPTPKKTAKKNTPVYDCLRCGMTHEYLVKSYVGVNIGFKIIGVKNILEYQICISVQKSGLELLKFGKSIIEIQIYLPKLIEDFKKGFEKYKEKLFLDDNLKELFNERSKLTHLSRLI